MTTEPNGIESEWQPSRAPPETIGVSLSGGGHRASLFAAGALAAIMDAGLAANVAWLASASGGSLTNGYVAARGGLTRVANDAPSMVQEVIEGCSRKWGTFAHLSRRNVVRLRFATAIERSIEVAWLGSSGLLSNLPDDDAEHIFVAVDVGSLEPVFFSRVFVFAEGLDNEARLIGRPGALRLATAVRASAAFPGLPAVRLELRTLDLTSRPTTESALVLADGGLWNNLATSWQQEQNKIVNHVGKDRMPSRLLSDVDLHLVVDGSAPVRRESAAKLTRPVCGWLRTTLRTPKAMLQSTVAHNRRLLGWHTQWNAGGPTSHVNLHIQPQQVCARSALLEYIGENLDSWQTAHTLASGVRTTLASVSLDACCALIAMAYGLTAAHLADGWSVPYNRFRAPSGLMHTR